MLTIIPPTEGAKYRCLSCDTEWTGVAGPQKCPVGGDAHKYIEWLNYEERKW